MMKDGEIKVNIIKQQCNNMKNRNWAK